jgi:hypothetical protein
MRIFNNKNKIDEIIDDIVYYCNDVEKFPCTFIEDVKRALKSSNYGLRLHFFGSVETLLSRLGHT